jgi:hypothetical protein
MAGDHPEPFGGSEAQGAEAARRNDERLVPSAHARDARGVAPGGDGPRELPSGEIRFPGKYGVRDQDLPDAVLDHTREARRMREYAEEELSSALAKHLAATPERRTRNVVEMQEELLRVRYAGLNQRWEAIAEARVLAATDTDPDPARSDRVPAKLVVAQTYRDLADDELRMETVLFEQAKQHLDQAYDYADRARREAGADPGRQFLTLGFRAEVSERLGGLTTQWASESHAGWVTGSGGALDHYRYAIHDYRAIGDHEAAERVSRLRDSVAARYGRGQEAQGS